MEWSKALFGWILLPLILGNLVARWSVGPPLAGESRIALVRWWARSQALAGQVKTGAPSNATPGGATDGKGTVQITVIKPEDNKFRMVDFVGEPDIMRELRPFIEKAKAQRIAHEEQVKATREKLVAAKKPAWEIEKELASLRIPPIPEGRYGHQQNTMYLLEGKPGTGKSLLPLVAAGEAGITLLVIAGTLQRIFIGAGTQNLEAVVEMARKHSPCIVFWDEAEEGAKQRSEHVGGGANNDDVTAALLRALDGPETKVGIFNGIHWVLATNHVNKIDEAVKRSGRLKILKFRLPGLASIKKLLAHFLGKYKKLPFAADFQPADGAHMLLGKSGADIQELARLYAGYAEEVAEAEEKRLKARALVLTKRLSDSGGKGVDVEQQLEKSGLLSAQIEEHVNSLTFGQTAFVESVQRLLMGRKKEEGDASYPEVRDTAWHEGLHAVANAVMERLGLINWKVRFYTVASREQSLGLMWASPDNPENLVSVPNVLARAVTAYAGAMAQLVGHDDNERWGKEIDLYRDSGPTSDNEQAADLIHKSICMFGGSLYIGPICKGKSGYSWATEAGAKLVNDIDKETRIRQKLAQFLSWRIASIVMQNEVMWDLFDEVLNTEERLITQSRFYELFDKLMADEKTNAQIEGLPAEFNRQSQNEINALNWMPERQPAEVRAFIAKKTAWLEARYVEAQRKLAERALIELEAEQIAAD
jgi:SpoVK/Ycf46/Vps4 family AAA+-type ATPase